MTAVGVLDSGILPPKKDQILMRTNSEEIQQSGRLRRSVDVDFVVKGIIEEFLLSWKAFFSNLPTVSITQLRAFGFSAVVYYT